MAANSVVGVKEEESISLSSLSEMTGFPSDFIKEELLVDMDTFSLNELRKLALKYLKKNKDLLN